MHIITVKTDSRFEHRAHCSCGFVSNSYGHATMAYQVGLKHKESLDGDTNEGHADIGEPVGDVKPRKRK